MVELMQKGWTRRELASAGSFLALALGVPVAALKLTDLDANQLPSPRQRALLNAVSQLVIPRTATPGAGDLGVGDFVALALAHGLEGSGKALPLVAPSEFQAHRRSDGTLDHAAWLETALSRRVGGSFLARTAAVQAAALQALDSEAYAEGAGDHPWRTVKALILTGYYTSEQGGSQELRFELVPGRWDPDLPATPQTIALSSDWTAVDFG